MSSNLWWDPFRDVVSLREAVDRLMQDSFVRPQARVAVPARPTEQVQTLPVDVYEANDELVIHVAVPGATSDDVDIRVENDVLTISAFIGSEAESEVAGSYTWYRNELGHGRFSRSLSLPETYDAGAARANMENGLMTLRIPKKEQAKPKQIKVSVESASITSGK